MSETEIAIEAEDAERVVLMDEYADGIPNQKLMSLTRLISLADGLQAVTGVGFRPRQVQIVAAIQGGGYYASVVTFDVDGGGGVVTSGSTSAVGEAGAVGTTNGNYATFDLDSIDADGFTLAWVKTGSPVGLASLYALCLR